jgi:DNA polymerase-3 subunit alpha
VPDVNLSEADFTARPATTGEGEAGQPGTIVFGLAAVRNVGAGLVGHIVAERERGGPYRDFFDFCDRVDPMVLNKRTVESLVKAGAFDSLGHPRKGLLHVFEQVVDQALSRRREQAAGILSLFDGLLEPHGGGSSFDDRRVPVPGVEFDKTTRLAFEKEMLGLYVSDHPLLGLEAAVRRLADCSITGLREPGPAGAPGSREGELTTVAGVVTSLTVRYTRRGERMASFILEDLESQIETLVFPKAMQSCGHLLEEDAIVCVKGRLDTRDDQPKLVCMELSRPELGDAETRGAEPLRVQLSPGALSDQRLVDLKALLLAHPGSSPVLLCLGDRVLRLPPQFSVEPRAGLLGELRELLGAGVALS